MRNIRDFSREQIALFLDTYRRAFFMKCGNGQYATHTYLREDLTLSEDSPQRKKARKRYQDAEKRFMRWCKKNNMNIDISEAHYFGNIYIYEFNAIITHFLMEYTMDQYHYDIKFKAESSMVHTNKVELEIMIGAFDNILKTLPDDATQD